MSQIKSSTSLHGARDEKKKSRIHHAFLVLNGYRGALYVYLLLAFILIYLPATSVAKFNNQQCVSSLPCSKKYLSEAYFNKHDILIDSNFQSFLKRDFPLHSCKSLNYLNTVIKVPVLHRDLIGEGSHRRLFSSLRISIQPDITLSERPAHFCEAVVIERLPSGVFADPFELQHLVQHGDQLSKFTLILVATFYGSTLRNWKST
ncbi:hypothetical protein MKW98_024925 [Papaver atlanticum]|uniref:Uncharacterized protein n=1 Tax=Papaver atlanticum TaxID=357466 RepID=A0AAD4T7B8_9MAGN|nr:hypothetical protein MKW98_024925 [Papaver atlanticum]